MRPRIDRPHWAEVRARAVKADALVAEINRMREVLGITPTAMLNSVALWPDSHWRQLAVNIGKAPPSSDTVTAVLAVLSRAALIDRLVTNEPIMSSDRDARPVEERS